MASQGINKVILIGNLGTDPETRYLPSGDIERAEQLREQEIIVPVAPPTRLEGTTVRTVWSAELVDIKALCAAIAEGKAPPDLVEFSQARGNRIATALKDAANVPGLRFIRSESVAVRA